MEFVLFTWQQWDLAGKLQRLSVRCSERGHHITMYHNKDYSYSRQPPDVLNDKILQIKYTMESPGFSHISLYYCYGMNCVILQTFCRTGCNDRKDYNQCRWDRLISSLSTNSCRLTTSCKQQFLSSKHHGYIAMVKSHPAIVNRLTLPVRVMSMYASGQM